MSAIPLIPSLFLSFAVQLLLWFNLLFPYNTLFEGFNRNLYLAFSLSGLFVACISIVFYRMLVFDKMSKKNFVIGSVLQLLCVLSCLFFVISSLTGWLIFV
jgi:hypothetical protein